jgi:hypothetical protein
MEYPLFFDRPPLGSSFSESHKQVQMKYQTTIPHGRALIEWEFDPVCRLDSVFLDSK